MAVLACAKPERLESGTGLIGLTRCHDSGLDSQFPSLLSALRCPSGGNRLPVSNFICFESK